MNKLLFVMLLLAGCSSMEETHILNIHDEFDVNLEVYEGTLRYPEFSLDYDHTGVVLETVEETIELDVFLLADEPEIFTLLFGLNGRLVRLVGISTAKAPLNGSGLPLLEVPKKHIILVIDIKIKPMSSVSD